MKKRFNWTSLAAGVALGLAGMAPLRAALSDNLVVHLKFNGNFTDSSSSGINGTPVGNPTFVTGLLGNAVSLTTVAANSQYDYVTLGTPTQLNFGSDVDFTVSFWCNYTNQSSDPVFIGNKNWASSGNPGWGIFMQGGGNYRVNTTDDASHVQSTTATPNVRDGTWHHILVTYQRGGNATVYTDGQESTVSSIAALTGSIDTGFETIIGQDITGLYDADMTDVRMDDLGIWRRALSAGEVSAVYNAGRSGQDLSQVPEIPDPYVQSVTPAANTTGVRPDTTITAIIVDGTRPLATNTVQLTLNGAAAPVVITKAGATTTIRHTPTSLLPSGVATATLVFGNNATPATLFTNTWSFTSTYTVLPPDLKVTPDTSKPGFTWTIFANSANQINSSDRTEAALAGRLVDAEGNALPNNADPNAQGAAIGTSTSPNPANAAIKFEIASVVNVSRAAGDSFGNFTPDEGMPGVPAIDAATEGLAVEIMTYVELPAGLTVMGVNSDDGFRTTAGAAYDVFGALTVGQYQGGRGASDTQFMLVAQEAGVYALRTAYENGGGDANVEWFTLKADGSRVLLNDTANGGLKAYRASTTPVPPYVKYVTPEPVPRQAPATSPSLTIVLTDASTAVDDASVTLKVDGQAVTPTRSRQGRDVVVSYAPATLLIPQDVHTAELSFKNVGGAYTRTQTFGFRNLKNLVLPTAVVTENFDAYAEGSVPTGWTAWNFTTTQTAGEDLDNLNSDSYKGWIVVSRSRLEGLKSRIFNVAPGQTFNGTPVDSLSDGSLLYAESDVRGGDQVQFITSKPFNLSTITNVVMTLSSLYEQNQDSIGAVEYSVDGGQTWLPIVYFLDYLDGGGDIVLSADGSIDAVTTLTRPNADTAAWVDNGVAKGDKYGDGIAAPITAALKDYIVPRANDNATVDKRIEVFRLPQAGKKADVRLRFAQLGTGSWYFGVDNLAFYEGPAPTSVTPPEFDAATLSGGNLTLSWTGSGTLEEAASVTGPWTTAASQANPQSVATSGAAKFFRIR